MDLNIFITTNGPGEISTWVIPVVEKLRSHLPDARIIIGLVPCPHSSGYESKVASQIFGATVLQPQETLNFIATGKLPTPVVMAREGVILHLGGDQLFSVGVSWRTRFPVLTYTESKAFWPQWTHKYLLRDQDNYFKQKKRGISEKKLHVVGDLMVDAVKPTFPSLEVRKKLRLSTTEPVISLLPGSKPIKVLYTTAFMVRIAEEIQRLLPNAQFILPQSPYTPLSQLRQAIQDPAYRQVLHGTGGKIMHDNNGTFIHSENGTRIHIIPPSWHYNALQISDLSITLPGTNTAELAVLGIPMVVFLPLDRPDIIPVDGLIGKCAQIPLVGNWLKKQLIQVMLQKMKYVSIPNQKCQQEVVPELIGKVSPSQVAQAAYQLLENPYQRREMSLKLKAAMPSDNATHQILMHMIDTLEAYYPNDKRIFAEYRLKALSDSNQRYDSDSTSNEEQKRSN